MSGKSVLIRVDGSEMIGMGHVMRCLYLVRELSRVMEFRPLFVMKNFQAAVAWVKRQSYPVVILPNDIAPDAEVARMCELVDAEQPVFVATDLRKLTSGLIEAVKVRDTLCVTIDEWGNSAVSADILTNGTIVPSWHHYQLEGEVQCYIGAAYALLDEQFARAHDRERPTNGAVPRILIALGGDDPFNLTVKAMKGLERIARPLAEIVVIGPAFTTQNQIRQLAAQSRHKCEVYENTSEMAELMLRADIGITGGGLMALELACTGTPGLIFCEVDHQLDTAEALQAHGAATNLGLGTAIDETTIADEVMRLLQDEAKQGAMSLAGRNLVDGKGCQRIAQAIISMLAKRGIR